MVLVMNLFLKCAVCNENVMRECVILFLSIISSFFIKIIHMRISCIYELVHIYIYIYIYTFIYAIAI